MEEYVRTWVHCMWMSNQTSVRTLFRTHSKKIVFRDQKIVFGGQVSHSHRPISIMSCNVAIRDSNSRFIAGTLSQLGVICPVCRTLLPCIIAVRRARCLPTPPCLCENRCHFDKGHHCWYVECRWCCRISNWVNGTRNRECKSVQLFSSSPDPGRNNTFFCCFLLYCPNQCSDQLLPISVWLAAASVTAALM